MSKLESKGSGPPPHCSPGLSNSGMGNEAGSELAVPSHLDGGICGGCGGFFLFCVVNAWHFLLGKHGGLVKWTFSFPPSIIHTSIKVARVRVRSVRVALLIRSGGIGVSARIFWTDSSSGGGSRNLGIYSPSSLATAGM